MKKLFFILTSCLFLSVAAEYAAAAETVAENPFSEPENFDPCSQIIPQPKVTFSTSYGKLSYDFSKNFNELTRMGKTYGILEQGVFASGLSVVGINWEVSLNSVSRIIGDYDICVIPTTVDVFIGYQNPVIFMSRELQPHSCIYNVVLRHEQTHHQINKTALEYFIPQLKKSISEIVKDVRPLHVTSSSMIDNATNELTDEYIRRIEPLISYFKQELLKEQSKLDNHGNYQMEGDLCKYVNRHKK